MLTLGSPAWVAAGPGPNVIEGLNEQFVSGAVNSIAPHPGNADILYTGTVNGGIWKTENATDSLPIWIPTTDAMPSLAISSLAWSPLDCEQENPANQTCQTLYAGTGSLSSFSDEGGFPVGIYRTENGGGSWTLLGEETFALQPFPNLSNRFAGDQFARRIRDVVPTSLTENGGQVILVGTDAYVREDGVAISSLRNVENQKINQLGVWRSNDGGESWTQANEGLPGLPVSDLIADSADPSRFYAAVPGRGVFMTSDGGRSWQETANDQIENAASAHRILMSVHNSPGNNVIYAGVLTGQGGVEGVGLETVYLSSDQGSTWIAMTPPRDELGPLHRAQGQKHGSILADLNDPNVVYAGGASQITFGNHGCGWEGRHFRGDAASGEWSTLECTPDDTTNAHTDSRVMAFDANGDLLEGNDGSIYRLTNRDDPANRRWTSLTGNINSFELSSIAYDSLNDIFISGSQDNGSPQQESSGDVVWSDITGGDGQIVQVDNTSRPGFAIRYSSAQRLAGFKRETFDSSNHIVRSDLIRMSLEGGGVLYQTDELSFETEYELNVVDPTRMMLGSLGSRGVNGTGNVYESGNQGDTFRLVASDVGRVNTIAYGGKRNGEADTGIAYVGTDDGVWHRSTQDQSFRLLGTYEGSEPQDIALDADDWHVAYVLDADGRVWRTNDAGASEFEDVTGNLLTPLNQGGSAAAILQSIELFSNTDVLGDEVVFLGGLGGVFATDDPYADEETNWVEFGVGLPNVQVKDVRFDTTDNLLYVATLGRGAWSVPSLSDAVGSIAPVVDLNGPLEGRDLEVTYASGGNAISIVSDDFSLIDSDSETLQSATITLKKLRQRETVVLRVNTAGTDIASSYEVVGEDGVLTLSGRDTPNSYQQVIKSATFEIESGNAASIPREVEVIANDGVNNSAPSVSRIRIQSIGEAPTIDLNGAVSGNSFVAGFRQDGGAVSIVDENQLLVSSTSDTLVSAVISITNLQNGEFEILDADLSGTEITKTLEQGVLTLSGLDSVSNYQEVLRTLTYDNLAEPLRLAPRAVMIQVFDETSASAKATSTVTLSPSLSAPVLDLNGPAPGEESVAIVDFDASFAAVAPDLILSASSPTLESATITLTTRPNAFDELLFVDTLDTGISAGEYDEDSGILTLSGMDTVENYERVLRTVEYIHFLESPDTSDRLVTFVVRDATSTSATFLAIVAVEPTPNAPIVDLNGGAEGVDFDVVFGQGGNAVSIASAGATIDDTDSTNIISARVSVNEIFDPGHEFLIADTSATVITASYQAEAGTLILSGVDTISNYEKVLRTLRYENDALRPSPFPREISVAFNDGEQFGTAPVSFVTIDALRPAPQIDLSGPNVDGIDIVRDYVEDSGPLVIAPDLSLRHAAGTMLQFADVQLFDCFGDEFCERNEELSADTTGTSITASYSTQEGKLLLEGPDTIANFQQVLRTVAYENRSQAFEFLREELDFFALDVNGEDNTWTLATLQMKNVNDAPTLDTSFRFSLPVSLGECDQTPEQSRGIYEDDLDSCFQQKGDLTDDVVLSEFYLGNEAAAEVFDDVDLFFTDFEEDDAFQYPAIAVVGVDNTNGNWQFSTDFAETWRTFENVSESNAVLLSSDIANRVRFVPNKDFNGTVENGMSFRVWDQTTANPNILQELKRSGRRADTSNNGGSTAFSQDVGELSITVFAVNDPPTFIAGENQRTPVNAGAQVVEKWATEVSPGPENETGQALDFVVTTDNPSLFSVQPSISDDGTLRYTPAADGSGIARVMVRLMDDGGIENSGVDTSMTQEFTILVGAGVAGDANMDQRVDFADFLILSSNFGRTQQAALKDGDFDGDGDVDFGDFLILSQNFGNAAAQR